MRFRRQQRQRRRAWLWRLAKVGSRKLGMILLSAGFGGRARGDRRIGEPDRAVAFISGSGAAGVRHAGCVQYAGPVWTGERAEAGCHSRTRASGNESVRGEEGGGSGDSGGARAGVLWDGVFGVGGDGCQCECREDFEGMPGCGFCDDHGWRGRAKQRERGGGEEHPTSEAARRMLAQPGSWWFWGAADNIRLPAANAVKLAEMLA